MRIAAAFLWLFSFIAFCQTTQPVHAVNDAQPSTVTVYMTGNRGMCKIFIDDVQVERLDTHHEVSFQVRPGYHELTAKVSNPLSTSRAIHLEPGQRVYFVADWEHAGLAKMMAMPSMDNYHLTLSPVRSVLDLTTKEDKLKSDKLNTILTTANPTGADPSIAQQVPPTIEFLTDSQVRDAIFQGIHDSPGVSLGYTLNDTETNLLSGMVVDGGVTGYSVTVYTASTWIEKQAATAHWLMKPYTEADVDTSMRQDVLLILATPSTPGKLTGQGITAGADACHVVLADESKKRVIQPLHEETAGVRVESALRSMEYGSVLATFSLDQLKSVQNLDGEFLIAVTGGYRKFFKVKRNTPLWAFMKQHE